MNEGAIVAARMRIVAFGFVCSLVPQAGWSQNASFCPENDQAGAVSVRGDVERALDLSLEDLRRMPRKSIRIEDPGGVAVPYEGVSLIDILALAGVPVEMLRGAHAATVVVAEARDGYRAAYALAELDGNFSDRSVVLVDQRQGLLLADDEGPYRMVVQGEQRRSRWIRQVFCIRIVRF